MRRREFIVLLGGMAATPMLGPPAARAQQAAAVKRVAVLSTITEDDPEMAARFVAFREELEKAGWIEGRNIRFDRRSAAADADSIRAQAAALLASSPDVLVTNSNLSTTLAGRLTRTVPIVFATAGDPVGTGLISNMAHPGGNLTGFASYEIAIAGKWLELLREVAPRVTRVAAIYTQGGAGSEGLLHTLEALPPSAAVRVTPIPARAEIGRDIAAFAAEPDSGIIAMSGPTVTNHRQEIFAAAAAHRLPAIFASRYYASEGGLMSYSADNMDLYRRAAGYVARILRGERPGDLPVQVPTKFELVVNLKTAKALGLAIPESFLLRADEVIE